MTEIQLSLSEIPECPRKREVEDVTGLARFDDPATSQDAAKTITGRTERLLLQTMAIRLPDDTETTWTADELCDYHRGIYGPTLVSALSRLKAHKLIEPTGETRPSRRGCAQTVYRMSP